MQFKNLEIKTLKKEIYIFRHGETDYNLKGLVQGGSIDAPLNETGLRQSGLFYKQYAKEGFEKIYHSKLIRTRQSIEPFLKHDLKAESHEGLNEMNFGIYEGRQILGEQKKHFMGLLKEWAKGNTHIKMPSGESPEEVANRQRPIINKWMNSGENKILVCMHGRAIRILLCTLLGIPLNEMDQFRHTNTGLYKVVKQVHQPGELVIMNSILHLQQ